MTDFLTIKGTPYPVQVSGATEGAAEYSGSRERAFDMTMRSTRANRKRNYSFVLGPITPAAYDSLVSDTASDAVVAVSGGFLNGGAAFNAMVDITSDFVVDKLSFLRVVHAAIVEA